MVHLYSELDIGIELGFSRTLDEGALLAGIMGFLLVCLSSVAEARKGRRPQCEFHCPPCNRFAAIASRGKPNESSSESAALAHLRPAPAAESYRSGFTATISVRWRISLGRDSKSSCIRSAADSSAPMGVVANETSRSDCRNWPCRMPGKTGRFTTPLNFRRP
jgi:hypothetical protein